MKNTLNYFIIGFAIVIIFISCSKENPSEISNIEKNLKIISQEQSYLIFVGDTLQIKWETLNVEFIDILISYDNKLTWKVIQLEFDATIGQFNFTLDDTTETDQLYIKIRNSQDYNLAVISSAPQVVRKKGLVLTNPLGGIQYSAGDTLNINWEYLGVNSIDLFISYDNESSWEEIATNILAEKLNYRFILPLVDADQCIIKIQSHEDNSIFTHSGKFVVKVNRYLNINLSSTTTEYVVGDTLHIQWQSSNVELIDVYLILQEYDAEIKIGENINASLNSFTYIVTNNYSTAFKVRINDSANPNINSTLDFTLLFQSVIDYSYFPYHVGDFRIEETVLVYHYTLIYDTNLVKKEITNISYDIEQNITMIYYQVTDTASSQIKTETVKLDNNTGLIFISPSYHPLIDLSKEDGVYRNLFQLNDYLMKITTENVPFFGDVKSQKTFEVHYVDSSSDINLIEGVGFGNSWGGGHGGRGWSNLQGAFIDGVVYGDITFPK